jgi:hypothetical protein
MRRILWSLCLPLCLVLGFLPALAGQAHADDVWCFDDPVISVNGHLVDVKVEMPLANLLTMRATTLTVVIPKNVSGFVVLNDISVFPMKTTVSRTGAAWSGHGEVPITVLATVMATTSYATRVIATADLSVLLPLASVTVTGTTNTTMRLSMGLGE